MKYFIIPLLLINSVFAQDMKKIMSIRKNGSTMKILSPKYYQSLQSRVDFQTQKISNFDESIVIDDILILKYDTLGNRTLVIPDDLPPKLKVELNRLTSHQLSSNSYDLPTTDTFAIKVEFVKKQITYTRAGDVINWQGDVIQEVKDITLEKYKAYSDKYGTYTIEYEYIVGHEKDASVKMVDRKDELPSKSEEKKKTPKIPVKIKL